MEEPQKFWQLLKIILGNQRIDFNVSMDRRQKGYAEKKIAVGCYIGLRCKGANDNRRPREM